MEMHVKKVEFKKMIFEKKKIRIFPGKLLRKFWELFPGIGSKEIFTNFVKKLP